MTSRRNRAVGPSARWCGLTAPPLQIPAILSIGPEFGRFGNVGAGQRLSAFPISPPEYLHPRSYQCPSKASSAPEPHYRTKSAPKPPHTIPAALNRGSTNGTGTTLPVGRASDSLHTTHRAGDKTAAGSWTPATSKTPELRRFQKFDRCAAGVHLPAHPRRTRSGRSPS